MNKFGILAAIIFAAIVAGCFVAIPYYNVWQQEMSGKAEFAKAEQNRKIKIEEAKANPVSYTHLTLPTILRV